MYQQVICVVVALLLFIQSSFAQRKFPSAFSFSGKGVLIAFLIVFITGLLIATYILQQKVKQMRRRNKIETQEEDEHIYKSKIQQLDSQQLSDLIQHKMKSSKTLKGNNNGLKGWIFSFLLIFPFTQLFAQEKQPVAAGFPIGEAGIIITLVLLTLPILAGVILLIVKVNKGVQQIKNQQEIKEAKKLAAYFESLPEEEARIIFEKRKSAVDYQLSHKELAGNADALDNKGLIQIHEEVDLPIVALKKKAQQRPNIDPALSKMILWYFISATAWLVFGTTVGEYLGIKFVAPDADHIRWLSFGRLRPVHTNAVFWGWASLGMLGLGYYIVPRVSNTKLASIKWGWYALFLINAAVIAGTICLMAGINNGGGEYREYIWPVMLLFAVGIIATLINFLVTISKRTTREIYISNWYIIAAIIFAIVITLVAYLPFWQNGLGETIIQGYYMHQGVGMWFMLFTLGIVYYLLPQQLNKPIYSYSLGILAFWTQILFYTLIGTHHFVFSAIPWWLQTIAIIGSAGMIIPVIAGTTNFIMTFKGAWYKIKDSYTLPFFLVGIIFYFTGSLQGTAEAFRSTNLIWHFTDFTVAHSHITMYGIICFFLWAGIYAIVPRLTGREAPQITIGAHFWMALIGLLFYSIPLMYGSTLRGLMWIQGKPFTDSITMMAPYWLWRAIGGSLMWLSHIFFAYNMYRMLMRRKNKTVTEMAVQELTKIN